MPSFARVDPTLELAIRELAASKTADGRRLWRRPAVNTDDTVLRYSQAVADPLKPGTIGDVAVETLQYDWMTALQRSINLMNELPEWWEAVRQEEEARDEATTGPWYAWLEEIRQYVAAAKGVAT